MVLESRTRTGDLGEDCAVHQLRSMGYRILARNWRGKRGEVDVIAQDGDLAVAVEVKSRSGCGTALDAAHWMPSLAQQRRIVQATHDYVRAHQRHLTSCRFDVMLVRVTEHDSRVLQHLMDVFDATALLTPSSPPKTKPWGRVR